MAHQAYYMIDYKANYMADYKKSLHTYMYRSEVKTALDLHS